jgi:CheY-like chemotaxis protein
VRGSSLGDVLERHERDALHERRHIGILEPSDVGAEAPKEAPRFPRRGRELRGQIGIFSEQALRKVQDHDHARELRGEVPLHFVDHLPPFVIERDGLAGQERASAEFFDLILLDIQLPTRDGLEVCRELRRRGVRTPIYALSASVLPEQVARTSAAGFDLFLSKPITPNDLRGAVRRMIAGDAGRR